MSVDDLSASQTARVVGLNGLALSMRRKLLALGVLPQTSITLVRRAPLGDPLQVRVNSMSFAISREQAQHIEVEQL